MRRSIISYQDSLQIYVTRSASGWERCFLWTPALSWWYVRDTPVPPIPRVTVAWDQPPPARVHGACPHVDAEGHICGRDVQYWPLCKKHLNEVYGVEIRQSGIEGAGLGIFTTRKITVPKGSTSLIVPYGFDLITSRTLALRYPGDTDVADYTIACFGKRYFIDAKVHRGIGSMANNPEQGKRANTAFIELNFNSQMERLKAKLFAPYDVCPVWLSAGRSIPAGREIFVRYGKQSWISDIRKAAAAGGGPGGESDASSVASSR